MQPVWPIWRALWGCATHPEGVSAPGSHLVLGGLSRLMELGSKSEDPKEPSGAGSTLSRSPESQGHLRPGHVQTRVWGWGVLGMACRRCLATSLPGPTSPLSGRAWPGGGADAGLGQLLRVSWGAVLTASLLLKVGRSLQQG